MMRSAVSILIMSIIFLGLTSCHMIPPRPGEKIPLELAKVTEIPAEEPPPALPEKEEVSQPLTEPEIRPGTGIFIHPPRISPKTRKAGTYSLNFDDADLNEVAKVILGDILKLNYVISPKARGRVTLQTTRPLRRDEVLPTLEMALRMNGLAIVQKNGFYWIGPAAEATTGAPLSIPGKPIPPGYQIRIFPLHYIGVDSMKEILKPTLPPKALLYADTVRNLLMVAGTADELAAVQETVNSFDINYLKGMSVGLYPLYNLDAETLSEDLKAALGEKILSKDSALLRILPIKRLNAVMVITAQPDYLQLADTWIKRLDRALVETSGSVHVYRAQNVDAVKLAETLNQIFTGLKPEAALTIAPGLKKTTVTSKSKQPGRKITHLTTREGKDIRIIADEPNNALIIIADQENFRSIERVIKQLDRLPLQVLIDASIVEVTLTDDLRYGLEWYAQNQLPKKHSVTGFTNDGLNLTDAAKEAMLNTLAPGFTYVWQSSSQDIGVILHAASENGKLNVISSPSLMVLNNHEAKIVVGDQISLQTAQSTNTGTSGDNPIVTNTFQQRDTGVQLTIKPRVNSGGLVIMELEQKVDDVGRTREGSPNPDIIQRQITTTVAVKDGDTLVLGGLIKDNRSETKSGIPILHRIPWIGNLFGTTNDTFKRTELVVLITPRVVENRRDAYDITNEFKQRLRELYQSEEHPEKAPPPPPGQASPSLRHETPPYPEEVTAP